MYSHKANANGTTFPVNDAAYNVCIQSNDRSKYLRGNCNFFTDLAVFDGVFHFLSHFYRYIKNRFAQYVYVCVRTRSKQLNTGRHAKECMAEVQSSAFHLYSISLPVCFFVFFFFCMCIINRYKCE